MSPTILAPAQAATAPAAYQTIVTDAVAAALAAGATAAEAWLTVSERRSVRVRHGAIDEQTQVASNVLGLRVFVGDRAGTMTTTDFDPAAIRDTARLAVTLAEFIAPDPLAGLPLVTGQLTGPLDLVDPAVIGLDLAALRALAADIEAGSQRVDPRVRTGDGMTAATTVGVSALANSDGFSGAYGGTRVSLFAGAIAEASDGKVYGDYWETTSRHLAALDDPATVGMIAARRAVAQIGARPVVTQTVPVIWSPYAVATALVPPVVEAMSGADANQGQSWLIGREGEAVGSSLLTLVDDPTEPGGLGSRPFDAEGVASWRTPLLTAGRFEQFLYDSYQGRKAGRASTGHAARTRGGASVGIEPTNLSLAPGASDPAAMIAAVDQGLYLTNTIGFGVNPATGDYSRGAIGMWIERGELAYPVGEINIAGRLPDLLASVDAVGTDAQLIEGVTAPSLRMPAVVVSGR